MRLATGSGRAGSRSAGLQPVTLRILASVCFARTEWAPKLGRVILTGRSPVVPMPWALQNGSTNFRSQAKYPSPTCSKSMS